MSQNVSNKEIISKLNFTKFKREIINEINRARSDPSIYLDKIKILLEKINKDVININGIQVKLIEGRDCLINAVDFLKTQNSIQKIKCVSSMDEAANELLSHLIAKEELIETEQILYKDIYDPELRLNKFGACFGAVDEIIDCGCFDAEVLVISLIIGDGDENKLERNTLFLEEFKFIGIASNLLPSHKVCTIINLCEEFVSPGEYIPKHFKNIGFKKNDINCNNEYEEYTKTNNKLYLSKKIYNTDESFPVNQENESFDCYNKQTSTTDSNHTSSSKNGQTSKNRSNLHNKKRNSSLMNFGNKRNSINKFVSFINDQDKYLNSILKKLNNENKENSDNYDDNDDDDVYEYYEEITQSKKSVNKRNKNSIASIFEIEELEKEKESLQLPENVLRITWTEKPIKDPYDKNVYFIVEKTTYKDDGEINKTLYTKNKK